MKIFATSHFERKYKKLVRKDPRLWQLIDRKLALFCQEPNHNSLRLHKLSGKKIQVWSISVGKKLRLIFRPVKKGILVIDIGTHDEVY